MVKRLGIFFLFFFNSCTASRPVIDNSQIIAKHPKPIKVFGVGNWKPGYSVLTLTDANSTYFVIIARVNDTLRKGVTYIQ
jgi:hypothetical protein